MTVIRPETHKYNFSTWAWYELSPLSKILQRLPSQALEDYWPLSDMATTEYLHVTNRLYLIHGFVPNLIMQEQLFEREQMSESGILRVNAGWGNRSLMAFEKGYVRVDLELVDLPLAVKPNSLLREFPVMGKPNQAYWAIGRVASHV